MWISALIHKHRPELIDYERLQKSNAISNLRNAFDTAESQLGLTKFLDPEGKSCLFFGYTMKGIVLWSVSALKPSWPLECFNPFI